MASTKMLENVQVLHISKDNKEEVLEELSNAAIAKGYAKPDYHKAILEREIKYPTGLHIPEIEVAIPHADAEWANESSLTIGLLDQPVKFQPMDGMGGDVNAEIIFMLTIQDPKEQIDFLRAFSTILGTPDVLLDFKKSGDHKALIEKIRSKM